MIVRFDDDYDESSSQAEDAIKPTAVLMCFQQHWSEQFIVQCCFNIFQFHFLDLG